MTFDEKAEEKDGEDNKAFGSGNQQNEKHPLPKLPFQQSEMTEFAFAAHLSVPIPIALQRVASRLDLRVLIEVDG